MNAAPPKDNPAASRPSAWMGAALLTLTAFVLLGFVQCAGRGEPADAPAIFDTSVTLQQAIEASERDGKLVLAFATADWCGPCQSFKKGALSDPEVQAWVRENVHTVYIDVDRRPDEARALGVSSIPATHLLAGDDVVGRTTGNLQAAALLRWLEQTQAAQDG